MKTKSLFALLVASSLLAATLNPRAEAETMMADLIIIAAVHTMDKSRPLAEAGRTLDGKNPQGWIPEQKITVEEAVRAYTVGSAYAEFAEHTKGTLAPGKLADLVLLSQDIFRINPTEIEKTKVRLTIMDGKVVYEEKK